MKVIPTTYHGIRYRSRTEARWAVFFDRMGWPFTYEAEGVDLGGEWYLPDFWLPDFETWVEIKGQRPTATEISKAATLHRTSGFRVLLVEGAPGEATHRIMEWRDGQAAHTEATQGWLAGCRRCGRPVIAYDDRQNAEFWWRELGERCATEACGDKAPSGTGQTMLAAMIAATNERFAPRSAAPQPLRRPMPAAERREAGRRLGRKNMARLLSRKMPPDSEAANLRRVIVCSHLGMSGKHDYSIKDLGAVVERWRRMRDLLAESPS